MKLTKIVTNVQTVQKTKSQSQKGLECRKMLNMEILKRVMAVMQRNRKKRKARVKTKKKREIRKGGKIKRRKIRKVKKSRTRKMRKV